MVAGVLAHLTSRAFVALPLLVALTALLSSSGAFVPSTQHGPERNLVQSRRQVGEDAPGTPYFEDGSSTAFSAAAVASIGLIGAGMAAAGRAARQRRESRVTMRGITRGKNYLTPCKKGMKPLVNRSLASNDTRDRMKGWIKKYRKMDDVEDIMKKCIYGRIQFQFSSKHFTDEKPWFSIPYSLQNNKKGDSNNHHYDDALYVRKFINPAKFKKLELVSWELPENAPKVATLQELVAAGVQYGHTSAAWNPKMLPYLYSDFEGSHIFDLVQTSAQLNRACYYLMEAAALGATVLFVGTKEQASPLIKEHAEASGSFFCDQRFVGGLFTNFFKVRKDGPELMRKLQRESDQGAWKSIEKKSVAANKNKLRQLARKYAGVMEMEFLPDIVVIVDECKERNVVLECSRMGIPVIGLLDSNSNPSQVELPIPGNASGSKSIDLVLGKMSEAIQKGKTIHNSTSVGDRPEIQKEFDPWMFSKDRIRVFRRKSKRQQWHKTFFGNYDNFKKANPYGYIPPVQDFFDVKWNMQIAEGMGKC